MSHAREQIRDAVVVALMDLPTTKKNVFPSRVYDINAQEMPGLLVFTRQETSTPLTITHPRRMEHALSVMVEGYAKLIEGYDDKLDKIALEVTKAIYNSTSLNALIRDIFLSNTEIKVTGAAEKPVAIGTLTFSAKYHTLESDPETLIH